MKDEETIILDAPSESSCAVIETVHGSDFCLLVTEPTPFGLHDLKRALECLYHLKTAPIVCINKHDLNDEKKRGIREFCADSDIEVVSLIPFDIVVRGHGGKRTCSGTYA